MFLNWVFYKSQKYFIVYFLIIFVFLLSSFVCFCKVALLNYSSIIPKKNESLMTRFNNSLSVAVFGSAFVLMSSAAIAQENPLKAEMSVYQVNLEKNQKIKSQQTDTTKPNDVLEYQVEYTNTAAQSLQKVNLTLPIPAFVTYTGVSQPVKDFYASTDGQNFAKAPLTRVVNGKRVNVPFSEYRALQWKINEFKPKQKIVVSAQVRVNATP